MTTVIPKQVKIFLLTCGLLLITIPIYIRLVHDLHESDIDNYDPYICKQSLVNVKYEEGVRKSKQLRGNFCYLYYEYNCATFNTSYTSEFGINSITNCINLYNTLKNITTEESSLLYYSKDYNKVIMSDDELLREQAIVYISGTVVVTFLVIPTLAMFLHANLFMNYGWYRCDQRHLTT